MDRRKMTGDWSTASSPEGFAVIRRRPFWLHRQRSPCPASNGERRHNLLPPSLASPLNGDQRQLPSDLQGRNTTFFICSPHRSAYGKKPNVVLVKALLAFAAPNGAKIKATAYYSSPIKHSTEWVASLTTLLRR
nr:hypothetical protein Itr_chr08CG10620 [Ipomoea trifida]